MFTDIWHAQGEKVADWLSHAPDDADVRAVLSVTSSLTEFLAATYHMPLQVQLHEQFLDAMRPYEAELLGARQGGQALRRRVSLCYDEHVMFDAESILPVEGISQALLCELEAGVRPLANLLQEQGLCLSRSDLSVVWHDGRWGRRSVLRSALGTQALVLECFHPQFWDGLRDLKS